MNCVDCCYMPRTHYNFRGINGVRFDACFWTREKILRSPEGARVSSTLNVGSRFEESSVFGKMSLSVASNQRQPSWWRYQRLVRQSGWHTWMPVRHGYMVTVMFQAITVSRGLRSLSNYIFLKDIHRWLFYQLQAIWIWHHYFELELVRANPQVFLGNPKLWSTKSRQGLKNGLARSLDLSMTQRY